MLFGRHFGDVYIDIDCDEQESVLWDRTWCRGDGGEKDVDVDDNQAPSEFARWSVIRAGTACENGLDECNVGATIQFMGSSGHAKKDRCRTW